MKIAIKRKTVFTLLMMVVIIGISIYLIGYANNSRHVWEGMEENETTMTMPDVPTDAPVVTNTNSMEVPHSVNLSPSPSAFVKPSMMDSMYKSVVSLFTMTPQ